MWLKRSTYNQMLDDLETGVSEHDRLQARVAELERDCADMGTRLFGIHGLADPHRKIQYVEDEDQGVRGLVMTEPTPAADCPACP